MPDKWITIREWPELILERLEDAGVARVVLNRPERRNALNGALAQAFLTALDEHIRPDPELKVVVTKGNGPVFSSGLDLYYLREQSRVPIARSVDRRRIARGRGDRSSDCALCRTAAC